MKKRNILWGAVSIIMILALVLVSACTPKPTQPTGTVEIRATDAPPTGVSSIMVTTSNIEVHKAGASEDSWITVVSEEKTFDLVTIQGAEMFLGEKELEAGQYTQIRLDVTNVKVILEGKELIAKLPGEKLKVVSPWEVKPDQKTILTLDFDADKFVVITGNDQAQVKPIIKLEVSQGERALKKPVPDTTAPTVSLTINANGATDVPINTKVNVYFNEDMDPSTITTATFTLKKGTTPVSGTVTYVGRGAFFTPAANLETNTEYTATITTGAKDLAGNALASPYVWRWTTAAAPDTTVPMISSTVPVNAATDVPINIKVGVFFSEAMDPLTLTTTTFTLKKGTTPVSGTVTYIGVTATFTPAANLEPNTEYTATITTGAKDPAGNALASSRVWTFTTGAAPDTTAPTVSSTIPANGAVGVAINNAMSATFSEAIDPLTLTTTTFTLKRGTTPVSGTVTYVGITATFDPDVNLNHGTEYTATITTGTKDLAGNALAVNKVWTFTTLSSGGGGGGGDGDTNAPTVNFTIPANAATGVAVNSAMSATFSEAMNPITVTNVTFTLKQGLTSINGTVTYAGVTATFTPTANLEPSTEYTATITTGVKDLAGNALAVNKVWTFTTGAAAIANPTAPVLGEAGRFVILAHSAITTTGTTAISNGDIGITPAARTFITGFTPAGSEGAFDELTNGLSYAPEDANPAPFPYPLHYSTPVVGAPWTTTGAMLTQAAADLGIAYTFLAADPNPSAPTQVCPIELGGQTLTRGVYKTAVNVTIQTGDLTLDAQGDPDSVWIFSIDGTLTTGAPGGNIVLTNGALAKNVYWRTGGITTIGPATAFYGSVFAQTQVNVLNGASVTGSLYALTEQVTLIGDTVTKAP